MLKSANASYCSDCHCNTMFTNAIRCLYQYNACECNVCQCNTMPAVQWNVRVNAMQSLSTEYNAMSANAIRCLQYNVLSQCNAISVNAMRGNVFRCNAISLNTMRGNVCRCNAISECNICQYNAMPVYTMHYLSIQYNATSLYNPMTVSGNAVQCLSAEQC